MKDLIPVFIIAARNVAKTRNGKFFQEPVWPRQVKTFRAGFSFALKTLFDVSNVRYGFALPARSQNISPFQAFLNFRI